MGLGVQIPPKAPIDSPYHFWYTLVMRRDILEREADIRSWIDEHHSKAYICKQLRCKPETLDSYLIQMGIDYKGNRGGKGHKHDPKYKSSSEYLNSEKPITSHKLKLKLFRDSVKEKRCEVCNKAEWLGQEIPLELHHVDGDRFNNSLENLQVLCPNCHAIQPGNSGSNIGNH